MNDIAADDETALPPKRRGCFKSCFIALLVLLLLLTLVVWGGRAALRKEGERKLQGVVRELDATDPGWTLEKLEGAREGRFPPADESTAPLILEISAAIPKEWADWQKEAAWVSDVPGNHTLHAKDVASLRQYADVTAAVRKSAGALLARKPGGFTINHSSNPFGTLLPHVEKVRNVAGLVRYDAYLAGVNGDPDAAIRNSRVVLHLAKSIGDEPFLISQLVRIAMGRVGSSMALQVIAWGEAKNGLPELQAALWAEAEEPKLLPGLLGERATIHKLFENVENGTLPIEDVFKMIDGKQPVFWQAGGMRLYKALVPGDHAEALRVFNEYIAAAKLPPHEQLAAFKKIPLPPRPPDEFRYLLTSLFLPAVERMAEATIRSRAELYAASVAIACERFRQKEGRWPGKLSDIPKDILPVIPTDPYNGEPILLVKMPDGVAVACVGPPATNRNLRRTGPLDGDGVGWRLYDRDKRGLPPKPEADPPEIGP